ncbi:GRDP1 Glycine-rich domain-containing protein 1 [Candida maltosa Xu316]
MQNVEEFYFGDSDSASEKSLKSPTNAAFVSVLENCKLENFSSYRYTNSPSDPELDVTTTAPPQYLPSIPEAIVHLKLLKAFEVMKKHVIGSDNITNLDEYKTKQWQIFVTNACRRFIIFLSALKEIEIPECGNEEKEVFEHGNIKHDKFISIMKNLMPPLDVIMVWHAFLLNPKSFYDVAIKNKIFHIANYPFPLHLIDQFIDDSTFEFKVPSSYKDNYLSVLEKFTKDPIDLEYDYNKTSMFEHLVCIYCPICRKQVTDMFPITNDANTGFADKELDVPNIEHNKSECYHSIPASFTHDELRKMMLKHDITEFSPLQGTHKYFTHVICNPRFKNRKGLLISYDVSKTVEDSWDNEKNLTDLIRSVAAKHRNYVEFNPIYLTVPKGVEIGEDLVGCVLRQERFVEKMNKIDWLHSPLIFKSMSESAIRYLRFFEMLTDINLKQILVPTLDIDLLWHTHQLTMYGYFRDCRSSAIHSVIDHDDKIDEGRLDDGFTFTSKRYKLLYKEDYSICYCLYCTSKRTVPLSKLTKFFKTKRRSQRELETIKANPLYGEGVSLSHISTHNSIQLPTPVAKARREKDKNKTNWEDNTYIDYPFMFVILPGSPVTDGHFYGDGLCSSILTSCASVAGTCCNMGATDGAACVGAGLVAGACGNANIGGTVFEIGGVCGANNNNTLSCAGNAACAGSGGGNCAGGGSNNPFGN